MWIMGYKEDVVMEEFVEKLKNGAAKVFGEAEKITSAAISKTGTLVEQTKLNYAISSNEGKVKDIFQAIGKIVYEEYKEGNAFPENIAEQLQIADTLMDEISELKVKIADLKKSVVCPECGEYNKGESVYCSKCGERL